MFVRECSNSHAYKEFSILQVFLETGPLSFYLRTFVDIDQCKSNPCVVEDRIYKKVFGILIVGFQAMGLNFPTTIALTLLLSYLEIICLVSLSTS